MIIKSISSISNPTSIHGIYPYRGKISAIDAREIITSLQKGKTLMDPFCGSGTILYEARKQSINALGFDTNPLAVWLAKGKISLIDDNSLNNVMGAANELVASAKNTKKNKKMPSLALGHFHEDTAAEIMRMKQIITVSDDDYLKACFYGAIALAARGCNHYKWTSSTVGKDIQPKRYINFYDKFLLKCKKHYHPLDSNTIAEVFEHDSRHLSKKIDSNTVDYVFTSPPYFDALDYTAYYAKIIYAILGTDRLQIKKNLIQSVKTYKEDMKQVLNEIIKVTHDRSKIIFVVGDKKTKEGIINGGDFFSGLLNHQPSHVIERSYTGSSSQVFDKLNKTARKEQIVVWDRNDW